MGSYILSKIVINLLLIGLGWLLVVRGKRQKENQTGSQSFLSPGTLVLIGYVIIILNVFQLLWLFYAQI